MALINREALKRRFENYQKDCDEAGDAAAAYVFTDCIAELEDAPTIDAAPVVHGYVIDNGNPICGPCSACGESVNRKARYCSMCGARMGGEEHEAD